MNWNNKVSLSKKKNNHFFDNVYRVFIPSTPVIDKKQCYGRYKEITLITEALQEPGKHLLLFGGRGYGKTSIANIVSHNLSNKGFFIIKINCHRSLNTYTEIWGDIFKVTLSAINDDHLKFSKKLKDYFSESKEIVNQKNIQIIDVISFFKKVDFPFLIILDEADLIIQNSTNIGKFADTIKAFSDQLPSIKLLIVGIAKNSSELIGEHASLERCLVEVNIDRMNEKDLIDILDGGLFKIDMKADEEVKKNLVLFAHGFPYFIHLLSLYAVEDAIRLNYKLLVEKNFQNAVIRALNNMQENLRKMFKRILGRSPEKYEQILNAAMRLEEKSIEEQYYLSRQDPKYQINYEKIGFTSQELSSYLYKKNTSLDDKKITQILNLFCNAKKGVFVKNQTWNEKRHSFANPLFRAYLHYRLYEATETHKPVLFIS